jgi:hypothetical protein
MILQEAAAIATRTGVGGLYIDWLAITTPVKGAAFVIGRG